MAKNKIIETIKNLLEERKDVLTKIEELPKGYIQRKTVSGHVYAFRQWREGNTVKSVYVNENFVALTERKIQLRKSYSKLLKDINTEIKSLGKQAIKSGVLTQSEFDELVNC